MEECVFCKIAQEKIPADKVFEDKNFIAFYDMAPKAPVHVLVIPREHIPSVNHLNEKNRDLAGDLILVAQKVAEKVGIAKGYKLVFNVGRDGGQVIDHLHIHVLGGWRDAKERDAAHRV